MPRKSSAPSETSKKNLDKVKEDNSFTGNGVDKLHEKYEVVSRLEPDPDQEREFYHYVVTGRSPGEPEEKGEES